jgi:hypothetical protein
MGVYDRVMPGRAFGYNLAVEVEDEDAYALGTAVNANQIRAHLASVT